MRKLIVSGLWIVSTVIILVIVATSVYIFACRNFNTTSGDTSLLTREKIIVSTKPGEVTPLTDMGQFDRQVVYLMHPYQETIESKTPHADRINEYLRSVQYVGDEGRWSLVFVDDSQVRLVSFNRSEKLDVAGIRQLSEQNKRTMPPAFQPAKWAETEQAAFYTVLEDGRRYIVLGRMSKSLPPLE